jgi:iron complex outermembrane receptor protein
LGYQTHSEASAVRFSGNLGWRWNDTTETRFYVGYVHAESELPGNLTKEEIENSPRVASPTSVAFDEERNTDWARLAAKTTWRPSDDRSLSASLYWSWQDLDHPLFWNPFFLNGLGVLRDESHTAGADFRYVTTDPLWERRNAFTIGFAPAATRLEDLRYANNGGSAGAKVADGLMNAANLDLYAENQHYVTESLALVAGAQGTYAIRNYNDRFDTDPNGDQSRDQDYWGFNPKLGLLYDWAGFGQFFASVSRSFEPPTSIEFIQLGGPAGDILTRSLDAQTATTAEVGMRGERDRYAWDVTYYHSWLKDELLTLNDALGNPLGTVNGPDTTHQGVELGASVKLVEGLCGENAADKLMLRQIYNWSDFRFRDDDLYGDNRLPGIPEHVLRTELLYEHPCGFYVGPNVQWVPSRTWADYANTLRSDSYFTLGAKIGYRSARGLSVYFEARNLTDENYASAVEPIADASTAFGTPRVFHPGEGRSFYGGLEWKW